ncbi:hypothetical protein ACWGQ2_07280 [Arthrobacter sp. NPDC055585]
MFDTTTIAATLTIEGQDSGANHNAARETRALPARRAALGGNYVAAYGHPRSTEQHTVRPAAGWGYTARFDGTGHRHSAAAVDSYTASFGPAGRTPSAVTSERGRYTDANL